MSQWVDRYEAAARDAFRRSESRFVAENGELTLTEATRLVQSRIANLQLQYPGAEILLARGADLSLAADMQEASLEIQRRLATFFPNGEVPGDFINIDPTAGQLGEIPFTIRNAYIERPDNSASIWATIVAITPDGIPLLIALIIFSNRRIAASTSDGKPTTIRASGPTGRILG